MSHPPWATATRLLAQWGHVGSRGGFVPGPCWSQLLPGQTFTQMQHTNCALGSAVSFEKGKQLPGTLSP